MPWPKRPVEERFEMKYRVDEKTGCWLWTASLRPNGYSQFHDDEKNGYGHLFAYKRFVGPIPIGTQIDHLCRNRSCVNPAHLEAVTAKINVARSEPRHSANAAKTRCPRGHRLSGSNLYVYPSGGRACRKCRRDYARSYYHEVRKTGDRSLRSS